MPIQPSLQNYSPEDLEKAREEASFFGIPAIGSNITLGQALSYLGNTAKDKIGSYVGGEAGNFIAGEQGREIGSNIGSFLAGLNPSHLKSPIKYSEGVEDPSPSPLEKIFKGNKKFENTNYTPLPPGGVKELIGLFGQSVLPSKDVMEAYDVWARRHPMLMGKGVDAIKVDPFMIGANGSFIQRSDLPKNISINKHYIKNNPNTTLPILAHETVHAAQRIRRMPWDPEEYNQIIKSKNAEYFPYSKKWLITNENERTPYWHKLEGPAYKLQDKMQEEVNNVYPERMSKLDKLKQQSKNKKE